MAKENQNLILARLREEIGLEAGRLKMNRV